MAAVLVTGGAGFIGSHVCERLLARGERVICLDSFTDFYEPALKERNLSAARAHAAFTLHRSDIRDGAAVRALLQREAIDRVIHLAAWAGVRPSIERAPLYVDVNLRGTQELLEACAGAGVGRVLFASSSSVYGAQSRLPFREDDPADRPISPYGATKRGGELLCHAAHAAHGLDVTCLRFFTVYGPRQRPEMAIHKFARLVDRGAPVPVHGDGSSSRDYTYVDDIVDGVMGALDELTASSTPAHRVYNLGAERPIALAALVDQVAAAVGKPARVQTLAPQRGDVPATFADVSLARERLGFAPHVTLEDGLRRFVAWMRSEGAA